MADVISNIIDDKQDIKNQLGSLPNTLKIPFRFTEDITPKTLVTKQEKKILSGSNFFILNSATYGVLGTNKLGDAGITTELYSVIPSNNIFEEYFNQDMFINTSASTGVLYTTNGTYTIDDGEIIESEVIAKLRTPIVSATVYSNTDFVDTGTGTGLLLPFTLGVSTFGGDTVIVYLSNDSGANWYDVTEGVEFTFPTNSVNDELKYKIESTAGSLTIADPLFIKVN